MVKGLPQDPTMKLLAFHSKEKHLIVGNNDCLKVTKISKDFIAETEIEEKKENDFMTISLST